MVKMAVKAHLSLCRSDSKWQPIALLTVMFALLDHSSQHGFVIKPPSRAYLCSRGSNRCYGPVKYEPQSIEAAKGFPEFGPPDGHIAGGGLFPELDETGDDRWQRVKLETYLVPLNKTHLLLPIRWRYTAPHRTRGFSIFGTVKGYNACYPLKRRDFRFLDYVPSANKTAYENYNHTIAKNKLYRRGVLLSIWYIDDTMNAFYQVIDYRYSGSRKYVSYRDRSGTLREGSRAES